jgi:hypothetical protein
MNLAQNLCRLQNQLANRTYRQQPYFHFVIHEPKVRQVYAPRYADRVVQHCLCDNILAPVLDRRLIYDNAACRVGKGTHFALNRMDGFLRRFYRQHGTQGWFLKCDIRNYFASIDHEVLLAKLNRVFSEPSIRHLLADIIASYRATEGVGLPLGNQTSQWFALYYLDSLDRFIKEKLQIAYYTRYMDDMVLIHPSKEYLRDCLVQMRQHLGSELKLEFNAKTQIFPVSSGVPYLGFHTYMTATGKVIRRLAAPKKTHMRRCLASWTRRYATGEAELAEVVQRVNSYSAHLSSGHTYALRRHMLSEIALVGKSFIKESKEPRAL